MAKEKDKDLLKSSKELHEKTTKMLKEIKEENKAINERRDKKGPLPELPDVKDFDEIKKETPTIPVKECQHLRMMFGDSGYYFPKEIRDFDIICRDCGTPWNLTIKTGTTNLKATPGNPIKEWRVPDLDVMEQDLKTIAKIVNAWL